MSNSENDATRLRRKIKTAVIFIIIGLLLNGISSIPLQAELKILLSNPGALPQPPRDWWIYVNHGLTETNTNYPFMRYGFDWLAFAHVMIAIAFIGPFKDPIKNEWIIQWGIITSALSIVMALCGERLRDIPLWWSFIDAFIAVVALIILLLCNGWIKQLKKISIA